MAETAYDIFNEVQDLFHPCGPDTCENNNRVAAAFDRLKAIPADAVERIAELEAAISWTLGHASALPRQRSEGLLTQWYNARKRLRKALEGGA